MSRRRGPARPVRITQPKRLPGEVPWLPAHNYDCSGGHYLQSDRPLTSCPTTPQGQPCTGTLTPVGKGSRTKAVAA